MAGRQRQNGITEILRGGRTPNFATNTGHTYSPSSRIPLGIRTPQQASAMERDAERQIAEARKHEHEQRRMGGKRGMHHKGAMSFDEFAVANREFGKGWHRDKSTRNDILKRTGRAF